MKYNAKPFMKFPGGKSGIINELISRLPGEYNKYIEPFVGGGALFFNLQHRKSYLGDLNSDIINCYHIIKNEVNVLITCLEMFQYREDDPEYNESYYYSVREWDRKKGYHKIPNVMKAARTIFLSKTCYNGLFRVNSNGQFNVPFGKYKNPQIIDKNNLIECSKALKENTLIIDNIPFDEFLENLAEKGDFVYLDPPYHPISETSSFTAYNADKFSLHDQRLLAQMCVDMDRMGVKFMLTNSNTPEILSLYSSFNIEVISSPRSINREKSTDVIVRNY